MDVDVQKSIEPLVGAPERGVKHCMVFHLHKYNQCTLSHVKTNLMHNMLHPSTVQVNDVVGLLALRHGVVDAAEQLSAQSMYSHQWQSCASTAYPRRDLQQPATLKT